MSYLILNKKIKEASFIRSQLEIQDLLHLYIGKNSYVESFLSFLPKIDKSKIFFTDENIDNIKSLANFLQYRGVNFQKLDPNEDVFYYDLNLFPNDPLKLEIIFDKLHYTDETTLFYEAHTPKHKNYLPIFKIKARQFSTNFFNESSIYNHSEPVIEIDLTDLFLFLDKTSDVLQLFSSNFELRYFNRMQSQDNYFVKSSNKSEKMLAEFNFLTNIPTELKPYYPQVGEFQTKKSTSSYQVEKIYMFDVSKHLINRVLNKDHSNQLLSKLSEYLTKLPRMKISKNEYKQAIRKNFIDKNKERFAELKQLQVYAKLNQLAVFQGYNSCDEVFEKIQNAIENYATYCQDDELYFSHGDLCFSNILFDSHTLAMKFIDPRGFINNINETYRPIYYDLAKLSHSFMGFYDLIVYDLVDIKFNQEGKLSFDYLLDTGYLQGISTTFAEFAKKLGLDLGLVRLFEASLFMSMIPLHQEIEKKMLAQFLQAIKSLEESMTSIKDSKIYS